MLIYVIDIGPRFATSRSVDGLDFQSDDMRQAFDRRLLVTSEISNDNMNPAPIDGPDAHGQAALLLVESLVHGLIARQVITYADAVEIVDVAAEVRSDIAGDLGEAPADLVKSVSLLNAISSSLRWDVSSG